MKFDISKIEMSNGDIRRKIKLPTTLTKELAELMGIVIGDGHLGLLLKRNKSGNEYVRSSYLAIAGNCEEKEFLTYIQDIFYLLFDLNLSYYKDKRSKTVVLKVNSKALTEFFNKICGIPLNRKTEIINIPEIIKCSNKGIKLAFLRGLADTDFSVTFKKKTYKAHYYPVIKASFRSRRLVQDLEELYTELGFKYCVLYNQIQTDKRFGPVVMHHIYLNGTKNLYKWIRNIGFSNYKFNKKVDKWLKDGACPPGY